VKGTNFTEIDNPLGATPDCVTGPGVSCGWEVETTLDVEWAHAMAPGAKIILVTVPTTQDSDFAAVDYWISQNLPVGPVSHSYGDSESLVWLYDFATYEAQYSTNAIADSLGYAYNYSTGDDGDLVGYPFYLGYPDVSFPSGSPNATAVGGTSLALTSTGNYKWEEGWGNNATSLNFAPPFNLGFQGGSGGGTSLVTAAPTWQSFFLSNSARQQPDVSMDADPFTGAEIIFTDYWDPGNVTYVEPIGGTSLSCPMFSAIWALTEQHVGSPKSGNAAPYIYDVATFVPGSVNDVVPLGSGHNAHGTIFNKGVPTSYSQWDLAQPYQNSPTFYEVLWNPPSGNLYTLTFGTDSSLTTGYYWDNVTGMGTPNGMNFITAF
jgi:subtilase family serine protease